MNTKTASLAADPIATSENGVQRQNACLRMAFLAAIGILVFVFAGVILFMALPQPDFELIGSVEEYPASSTPYDLRARAGYYLVNTGSEILTLDARAPRNRTCVVRWDSERGRFQDPCFGTVFDLVGEYLDGPPSAALGRYQVRIEDQTIWVSVK